MALMDVSHDGWQLALAPFAGWPEVARGQSRLGALSRLATRFLAWKAQRETVRLLNAVDSRDLARPRHHRHRVAGLWRPERPHARL